MISLQSILYEITNSQFPAISKESGKLVYFKSKKGLESAISAGSHISPKSNSTKGNAVFDKGSNVFANTKRTSLKSAISSIIKKDGKNSNKRSELSQMNAQNQGNWARTKSKEDSYYAEHMMRWQRMIDKNSLNTIDKLLQRDPPPPIKTDLPLMRGMIMHEMDASKFLSNFKKGDEVKLPIGSYTFDSQIALDFADGSNTPNKQVDNTGTHSIIIRITGEDEIIDGFCMNANVGRVTERDRNHRFSNWALQHEVLLPSNQTYNVMNVDTKELDKGKSLIILDLMQNRSSKDKLSELIDVTNSNILKKYLQYGMYNETIKK
jgi:hypothetical protein